MEEGCCVDIGWSTALFFSVEKTRGRSGKVVLAESYPDTFKLFVEAWS